MRRQKIKLDQRLLRRIFFLAKPYWVSDEKKTAWVLGILLIVNMVAETWFNVKFNDQTGEFTSALAAHDATRYWHSIRQFVIILVIAVPIYSYYYYLRDTLGNRWRRWMTHRLLHSYFRDHSFYHLVSNPEIDNPDQRISEDIDAFTQRSLGFLLMFGGAIFQLVAFSGVLWSISHLSVFILIGYAVAGSTVTILGFSEKLINLNYNQLRREADFRYGLVRVRENAESIAFYHGEGHEQKQLRKRFFEAFANYNNVIRWNLRLSFFQNPYGFFALVLPSLILAPRVLSGELEVGRVVEAAGAFASILSSLTLLVDNMEPLSRYAAGARRLDGFIRYLEGKDRHRAQRDRITSQDGEVLSFHEVTLQTPDFERTLVRDLTFAVSPGQSLLIVGPSGCGKSSLLRAMAGLWDSGLGTIERPKSEEVLFLPQFAYMILGNLRRQLCYPNIDREVPDEELREVLNRVNLPDLVERCGGFEVDLDFEKRLSVGERQRLAFARVLLQQPRYVFMDESTSALDPENEAALFAMLTETSTTMISVSHHPSVVRYHQQVLELDTEDGWKLHAADQFEFSENFV